MLSTFDDRAAARLVVKLDNVSSKSSLLQPSSRCVRFRSSSHHRLTHVMDRPAHHRLPPVACISARVSFLPRAVWLCAAGVCAAGGQAGQEEGGGAGRALPAASGGGRYAASARAGGWTSAGRKGVEFAAEGKGRSILQLGVCLIG